MPDTFFMYRYIYDQRHQSYPGASSVQRLPVSSSADEHPPARLAILYFYVTYSHPLYL